MIGAYVPGSGYRPGETMRALPKARYFRMSIYRVHPGEDNFISNLGTARRSIYDRVNLDRPDVIYKIISGAATGTYLVIAPLPSLASIDDGMQRLPEYAEPFSGAEGAPNALVGREHLLFRVDPRLSFVSAAFAGEDAIFWKPQR